MTIWAFILIICCPFSEGKPHRVTWEAPSEESCLKMRRTVVKEVKGYTMRATVGECLRLIDAPTIR